MDIRRLVIIAVPVGIVLAYLVMQSLTVGEAPNRNIVARGEFLEEVKKRSFDGLYDQIEAGFPEAYAKHVQDINQIALDTELSRFELGQEVIEESEEFIFELRSDNLQYLATAGRAKMLEVQRAKLAVLKSIQAQPEFCASVARDGLHNLDRFDLGKIDRAAYGRWVNAVFAAIIKGRDTPEPFDAPSRADWRVFLSEWVKAEGEQTPNMQAFVKRDDSDPELFCQGMMDFTRQLIADSTPAGLRVLVDYTANLVR